MVVEKLLCQQPGVPGPDVRPAGDRPVRGPQMQSAVMDGLDRLDIPRLSPDADGRFTLGEAARNVLRGMGQPLRDIWSEIKAHPVRQAAVFLGMAIVTALLPLVGTVVAVFELGQAAVKMVRAVLETVGLLRNNQPDDAERALGAMGEGITEVAMVAVESWLEKVVDINRAIPKTVTAAFRSIRSAIARLFGLGDDDHPDG